MKIKGKVKLLRTEKLKLEKIRKTNTSCDVMLIMFFLSNINPVFIHIYSDILILIPLVK